MEYKSTSGYAASNIAEIMHPTPRRHLWGAAYLPESYTAEVPPESELVQKRQIRTRNAFLVATLLLIVVWVWLSVLLIAERHRSHQLQRAKLAAVGAEVDRP